MLIVRLDGMCSRVGVGCGALVNFPTFGYESDSELWCVCR